MKILDWFIGIVEDVNDPGGQGRVRVRCLGYHTPDRNQLPTIDLPLATVILPTTSASVAGIGVSSTGLVPNTWVFGFFRDGEELQDPVILGTIASASGYDVGYDVTTNMGFGDPHDAFSGFVGNDIPKEAGTYSAVNGASYGVMANATAGGVVANTQPLSSSFDADQPGVSVSTNVADSMISIAQTQLNIRETEGNNRGPGIQKFWDATNNPGGYGEYWCAAFTCWIIQQAKPFGDRNEELRPKSASCFTWEEWARGKSYVQLRRNPRYVKRGDFIIFSFSHIGLAISDSDSNGTFQTIEGNTGPSGSRNGTGVFQKTRNISSLRSAITLIA